MKAVKSVCVSEDINKIRTSICEDFNPNEDCPKLEIWENEEEILRTSGSDVLKVIAKELPSDLSKNPSEGACENA